MALSMDEQRMLAEIERRLAAEDPGLAAKLSSFRRPGPAVKFRSTRSRIIGSLFTVALLAVVSLMVYAMVPFRAHGPKSTLTPQTSTSVVAPSTSAPAQGSTHASSPATARNATAKTATTTATTTTTTTKPSAS